MFTLPATKISPEKWPSQKRFHLRTIDFCGAMLVSGSARAQPPAQPPGKLAVNVLLPTRAPSEIRLVLLWAVSPWKKKHCRCFSEAFVQPWKPGCKSRNKIKTLTVKRCIMGNLVQGTQPLVPPKPLPGNKTSNKGVPLNFHQNILGESCVFWLFDFRVVNTWCKFRCFEFFGFAWRCLQNEKVDQRILCKWWLNQPNWAVFFELDHLSRYR